MTTRAIIAVIVLLGAPLIPLAVTWKRLFRERREQPQASILWSRTEATVTSLSFMVLFVGLLWGPVIGFDYSTRRFVTIYTNLALMVLVTVAAALGSSRFRLPLAASSLLVAMEWAYLAVVSSVV
jgi:hypothetical protein